MMPGPCPYCDEWLSGGDMLEGYCWGCGHEIPDYRYGSVE